MSVVTDFLERCEHAAAERDAGITPVSGVFPTMVQPVTAMAIAGYRSARLMSSSFGKGQSNEKQVQVESSNWEYLRASSWLLHEELPNTPPPP